MTERGGGAAILAGTAGEPTPRSPVTMPPPPGAAPTVAGTGDRAGRVRGKLVLAAWS